MKLLADEGVDRPIVERLRREGHDVDYVAELSPGIDDPSILARARRDGSLLLTSDKDFGELLFRQGLAQAGVLLLRLAGLSLEAKASLVTETLAAHGEELLRGFGVLTPHQLRIRRGRGDSHGAADKSPV